MKFGLGVKTPLDDEGNMGDFAGLGLAGGADEVLNLSMRGDK